MHVSQNLVVEVLALQSAAAEAVRVQRLHSKAVLGLRNRVQSPLPLVTLPQSISRLLHAAYNGGRRLSRRRAVVTRAGVLRQRLCESGGRKPTICRRFLGAGVAMSELALRLTLINESRVWTRTKTL